MKNELYEEEKKVEIYFYYCPEKILKNINKNRAKNNLSELNEVNVKNVFSIIHRLPKYLSFINGNIGSEYDISKRKMKLTVSVTYGKEEEMSSIFLDYIEFSKEKLNSNFPQITEQHLENFFKMREIIINKNELERELIINTEKTKQKLKI